MLTYLGALISIIILFIPGILIIYIFNKEESPLNFVDKIVGSLVVSGVWNYLFFLPRLEPAYRTTEYILGVSILLFFSIKKFYFSKKHKIEKKTLIEIGVSILVLIIGIVLIGYPLHKLNLSRLNLNPPGGDVQFSLFKTHLLRGGYSFLDDLYAENISSYPNFNFAQVALVTLLKNGEMALNAETYRLIIAVIIFWLFYAIGRSLNLRKEESILLPIFSLVGYFIWTHLHVYVAAGLSFFASLMFIYFSCRAFHTKKPIFWLFNGLAASLVIHSHMVHAAFGGIFTLIVLSTFIINMLIEKHTFKKIFGIIKPFIISGGIGALIFLLPLGIKYQFKSTNLFHVEEGFNNDINEWINTFLLHKVYGLTLLILIGLWLISLFYLRKKNKKNSTLLGVGNLFFVVLITTHILQIISIKTHRLAVYVDSQEFYIITSVLSLTLISLCILKIILFLLNFIIKNKYFAYTLRYIFIALILILILPGNPIYEPDIFKAYGNTIWVLTKLPEMKGERSLEGNSTIEFDYFGKEISKKIPIYKSKVLITPITIAAISGNLERQVVLYEPPYSNLFLKIPQHVIYEEVSKTFYKDPTEKKIKNLIKKYKITHIIASFQEYPELLKIYEKCKFLKKISAPNWVGAVFEVKKRTF